MALIDPNRVTEILLDCLFRDEELSGGRPKNGGFIPVEGVMQRVGFNPERVQEHREEITSMLMNLPLQFRKSSGGGWSFLNACNDKNDELWTGMHKVMDELVCLGIAIEKVKFLMPREMWVALPGQMPYFVVLD